MGVQLQRWKQWMQKTVRKIKVDYEERETRRVGSFTFILRSNKQLVVCAESGKILATLAFKRQGLHTVCKNPHKIMNALADNALPAHKADILVFVFSARHRKTSTVWANVFAVTVIE